ncbi:ABC transporter ATP-binding protein [Pelagibacterium lentulum]|uniref:ABC transporter ATP-binding protein n=1 Tax=Pelagibacterium lentulum TaxID=2029865 RepID=A0A916R862_9HYPH|nr:dipeptide ABC transporter ATP-binding protein [Pelagibacterium lentulum]GGA43280.1 ABC transporter ATP-binding protein [Pelagibacterium lentulum]
MNDVLVKAEGVTKFFGGEGRLFSKEKTPQVRAVDGVSFEMFAGETLAVVGESGCGKSTLGRLLLRLLEPTGGRIEIDGTDLTQISKEALRNSRRKMQMVFQDPYGSLSPRRTIAEIIAEPLEVFEPSMSSRARRERVADLLEQVGLSPDIMDRRPRQFSGGQRQRIGIARAIALNPALIVADEPVSALDVSVQAQIVNLLQDLQQDKGFSYFFVAHDLAVVRHIADRVMVMYLGRVVEIGPKSKIYAAPQHPYTQALLSAAPEPDPEGNTKRIILQGDVPSPTKVPSGCSFRTRCPLAQPICSSERPELRQVAEGQLAACHFAETNPIRQ